MRPRIVIALVTLGACLMLMTGSAQAANFTAGSYPATVFGEQAATPAPNTGIEGGTVFGFEKKLMTECATASFSGPLSAASSTLTVTPTLEGCRLFEVIGGSVNPNGCETRFHAGAGSGDEFSGTMDIVCPGTNKIAVVGTGCEVQIGSQSGLKAITYLNETKSSPISVILEFNVTGLTYTKTKDGFGCPLSGTGTLSDGVIAGSATMTAVDNAFKPVAFKLE